MKILVIKRDKIGDMLLTTPMLAHLRAKLPTAEIQVLANDYNAWVVAQNRDVDFVWSYPRTRSGPRLFAIALLGQAQLMWKLRRKRFDVAIVAGGDESPRAMRRALWCRARRTIAYSDRPHISCISDVLPVPHGRHEVERMLGLLVPLNIDPPTVSPSPTFTVATEWQSFAREWLQQQRLQPNQYVVLGLGARRRKKQPSAEQILRWAARWYAEYGLATVFMWTPGKNNNLLYPGDDESAEPVVSAKRPYIYPFRDALMPALGLIHYARTSIFPDSGLMHFAAASRGGVLGLFADTAVSPSPKQWAPRGARAFYLEAPNSVAELDDESIFATLAPLLTGAPA